MKILVEIPDEKIGEYMKLYAEAAREAAYEDGDAPNAFNWIHDELGYGSQPADSPYSARPVCTLTCGDVRKAALMLTTASPDRYTAEGWDDVFRHRWIVDRLLGWYTEDDRIPLDEFLDGLYTSLHGSPAGA